MTSIEWLYKLSKERELDKFDFEQAKEMHKQEIIDAWEMGRFNIDDVGLGEEYYQETFVSKGSDEVELPQEISDEDIEKAARDYDNIVIYGPPLVHFEQGAFWYREQLKNK